ncbi:MAG TPA: VWA domain-containing protein [Vicinamibacterales bacterium]
MGTKAPRIAAIVLGLSVTPLRGYQEPTYKAGNRTVAVYATVTGPDGRMVTNLAQNAFAIDDNGKRQDITLFANTIQPITAVVLLDRSGSMRSNFRLVERAAERFVDALQPGDKARIGSFSNRIQLDPRGFTTDRGELLTILKSELQPEGPTPLWNAIYVGVTALLHQQGRRVILVFTDGMDSPESGTANSLKTVIKYAEEEDVMVYAIGLAPAGLGGGGFVPGGSGLPGRGRRPGGFGGRGQSGGFTAVVDKPDGGLPKIAAATGGGYFQLTSANDLAATFAHVADELHHQYALGFSPSALDGKLHSLDLRVKGEGMKARARKSYLARAVR